MAQRIIIERKYDGQRIHHTWCNMSSIDTNDYVKNMEKYSGTIRQHLVSSYYYDTFDKESFVEMPASFFAELLKNENDAICKWYEIKALGDYKAIEYKDLVISVLRSDDVKFETGSSLYAIASYALGKMGTQVNNDLLDEWYIASESARTAILDAFGEMRCAESAKVIESLVDQLNDNEFLSAALSLSKCDLKGNTILQALYSNSDYKRKLIIIDALARLSSNDSFINDISINEPEVYKDAMSLPTSGIVEYKKRRKSAH